MMMKILKLICLSTVVIILSGCGTKMETDQKIEGLLYTDQSPVSIEIVSGKIKKITRIKALSGENKNIYIAPGLIDSQVNGYQGVSFSFSGGGLTLEGIKKATHALWEAGVTTYLPTLTTNSPDTLLKNFAILAKAKEDPDLRGSIPGFHLEGPYISPEDGYRGAHPAKYVKKPDWKEFMKLYEASGKNILQVTIAPEIEEAMEFISRCQEMGIIVGLGHHNASAEFIEEAVSKGARIATHLGNGCANMINRHVNPLWPQLSDDRLMISIICDGFHLRPEEINVFYKVKGPEKTIIVSDVTNYAGLAPGEYITSTGDTVELTPEGMIFYPAQKVLYGSASPLTKGVGHIMEVTGCSLRQAIRMASTNPAILFEFKDRGKIKTGMRADIILFTLNNNKIEILKTIVAGDVVYKSGK
jgi:N-acetylglucosamine-6-phosphate deacetylase